MRFDNYIRSAVLLLCVCIRPAICAQVQVEWNPQPQQNLGIVEEESGVVERLFKAYNTGADSWQVLRGFTSCGCTTVQVENERVVRPSDSTSVVVRFNPASKSGPFRETVTIQLSDGEQTFNQPLFLTGEVLRSKESISRQFPFALGNLRISAESIDFGEVKRGARVERHITFCNTGTEQCVVMLRPTHSSVAVSDSPLTLSAGATQDVTLAWDGTRDNEWGSVKCELAVTSNNEHDQAQVKLSAILLPDFSSLSAAQLAKAAQLKTERRVEITLSEFGKKLVKQLIVQNSGGEPLHILSTYSNVPNVKIVSTFPMQIAPGKSASVGVEIIPGAPKEIPITLISTDVKKPRQTVRIYIK